jgi:uncharacterized protein
MKGYDQAPVIGFLSQPESYGGGVDAVETIKTHISMVFLAGDRVLKLKRAVKYSYIDFSTLALRHHYCEAEVSLNRRTAPDLYKGVIAVTQNNQGELALEGEGDVVEWLVEMARFDQQTLFDQLAVAGKLKRHTMGELAQSIADFHMAAVSCPDTDSHKGLETTISSNAASFIEFGSDVFDRNDVEALEAAQHAALRGDSGDKIKARQLAGCVRHCHGDLHLRNICLIDDQPTLFDAIEFNDTFAYIDVLYDLSFLLMDLDYRGYRRLSNIVLNRYLDVTGDTQGLGCLGLFLSLRAAIRAHIAATVAYQNPDQLKAERLGVEARSYLDLARDYLASAEPRLVAVGGLSGSGKSRMGRELAPYIGAAPGARIARSDVLRKRLAGVGPLTKLPAQGYSLEMTRQTYDALYDETRKALAEGQSVVADAVFAKPEERQAIADVAREMGVRFDGVWLEAPLVVMQDRVTMRKFNPSDADAAVVRMQLSYDLGDMDWMCIDSSGPKQSTLEKGLKLLGLSVVNDRGVGA